MIDYEHLINLYLDDELTDPQFEQLHAWIKADKENARTFMRRTWLHRQVYDRMQVRDLQRLADERGRDADGPYPIEQLELLAQGSEDSALVDVTDEMLRRERDAADRARQSRARSIDANPVPQTYRPLVIPRWLAYGVAAVLMLGGFVIVTQLLKQEKPGGLAGQNPTPEVEPLAPQVATVTWLEGQPRLADGQVISPGQIIRQDERLELVRGMIELTFETGAVARFQGPATLFATQANTARLDRGVMTAVVPPRASGFTVTTPTMQVIDIGTEFGITVGEDRTSEVHVFVGEVTAAASRTNGSVGTPIRLLANEAAAAETGAQDVHRQRSANAQPFISLAPHVALLHRELVVNGDFEQGRAAAVISKGLGGVENIAIPGWEDSVRATVMDYTAAAEFDYPDPLSDAVPFNRGENYFAGMENGVVSQRIDVSELASLIDAGWLQAAFSADLGGFDGNGEYVIARVRFLDETGQEAGSPVQLQPVHAADRGGRSGFVARQESFVPPIGCRLIVIELETTGNSSAGYVADGYVDNVSLILSSQKN